MYYGNITTAWLSNFDLNYFYIFIIKDLLTFQIYF